MLNIGAILVVRVFVKTVGERGAGGNCRGSEEGSGGRVGVRMFVAISRDFAVAYMHHGSF